MSTPVRMKISELSRQSGVSVATIKFYQREGLMPPAERIGPNQAAYGQAHLDRLAVIRALREVADLKVSSIAEALQAIANDSEPLGKRIDAVSAIVARGGGEPAAPGRAPLDQRPEVHGEVVELLRRLGWQVDPTSAVVERLVDVLIGLRKAFDPATPVEALWPYAKAIEPIARMEIGYLRPRLLEADDQRTIAAAITGTILWEKALTTLRHAAHEHYFATALEHPESAYDPSEDAEFTRLLPAGAAGTFMEWTGEGPP